jgi:hypothetical protein
MSNEIEVVEYPIEKTIDNIRSLKLIDTQSLIELGNRLKQIFNMAIVENNILLAIDTMEQTKAIEDYVKSKVKRNQAEIVGANHITANRFEMLWELGYWLDENIEHKGNQSSWGFRFESPDKKPKFFLDDIGVTQIQSYRWQKLFNNKSIDQLREWNKCYLVQNGKDEPELLQWGYLWKWINPLEEKEKAIEPELELPDPVMRLYKWLLEGKKKVNECIDYLNNNETELRVYIFISKVMLGVAQGLFQAYSSINKVTENANENPAN